MADSSSCSPSYIVIATFYYYFILVSKLFQTTQAATNGMTGSTGFSADLIHRDSPLSPFYNPSETHSDRLRNAFRRSVARVNHYRFMGRETKKKNTDTLVVQSGQTLIYSSGEYFMDISIGTPPVVISVNADTGSDLTWTQCTPCPNCFKQVPPLFDPKQSSTYIELPCESLPCKAVGYSNYCTTFQNICEYNYTYVDGSFTNGFLATETISIGSVTLPDIFFGCGHNNRGRFDELGSGIIGLGRNSLSFISQFSPPFGGRKFSYCLVPMTFVSSGKIYFGHDSVVSGDGVATIPLVASGTDDISHYYLALEGVTVGEKRMALNIYNGGANKNKNAIMLIIDSGSGYTFLPRKFYDVFVVAMANAIGGNKRVQDPSGHVGLCYQTDDDIDAPMVTFHFNGNADVQLKTSNLFLRVSEHMVCLSMAPTDGVAIYGNMAQMNFLVGYDLDSQTVSFKPTDCTILQ